MCYSDCAIKKMRNIFSLILTGAEERAVEIAYYIIENQATVRQTAKKFGVSKSTIHIDVTKDVFL